MNLIILSYFMQGLNSTMKYYTKNEYFSMHILFTIVYLLLKQELNPRIYSKKKLITRIFVQATYHKINMHANI
jgi:hypothetical protein